MSNASHLLINEPPLQVLPSLAVAIGLNEAIVLQQLHFRLLISQHVINGVQWYYNSYDAWHREFPWWSLRTLRGIFTDLEQRGYVRSGNFNAKKSDRTKWYTIVYERLEEAYTVSCGKSCLMTRQSLPDHRDNLAASLPKTSPQDLPPKTSHKCLTDSISVGAGAKSPKTAPTHRRSQPAMEWTSHYCEIPDDPNWPLIDHCLTRYYAAYADRYGRQHPKLKALQLIRCESILSDAFNRHELDCEEDVTLLVDTYWARSFVKRDKKTRATDGNLNAFATVKNLNLLAAQLGWAGVDQDLLPANGQGGL